MNPATGAELVCSAKACRAAAASAVLWRNPRIHDEDRRKVWLACPRHTSSLRDFLGARGFPVEVVGVADIPEGAG